uniref:N-acetyl-gamma-glutamyl-phosphate reductase n=1 Tax=uncultured Bacillota bacterium TaxID=344338 RepID=A0A650EMP8_9FIRM|nr:N-acetyl-gamma-glutamyl-phosphate reductase [uncultured Firmicutes bacterium]
MIKAGVLGATGYAGIETARLLLKHPEVEVVRVVSKSYAGQKLSDIYPNLRGICDLTCAELNVEDIAQSCDVVFTALPHGASKEVIPALYEKGLKIIDLSGDFRYNDIQVYEKWYGQPHSAPELLRQSVYGLCELHRDEIPTHRLVGNPGCYTTCSILGLAPLVANKICDTKNLIIDAKSGVTGAGRGLNLPNLFCECTETMKAYKVATHRHTSEIEQELSLLAGEDIMVSFTPHLAPMKRGILATCYANLTEKKTTEEIVALYQEFYKDDEFVRVYPAGELPEVKHIAGSNYVGIGAVVDERLNRAVVVSCIDNLVKGAAGQAVQNMNLLFGLPENTGLTDAGLYL